MKQLLLAFAISLTLQAQAAEYKQYFTANGKQVTSEEAIMSAARGAEVMKCQSVEFKVSKSGTSIGIKNVKKPKKD